MGHENSHRDHVRRSGSGTTTLRRALLNAHERGVVIRDNDADTQGADDEEDGKSPVDRFEGGLDVCGWTFSLGGCHSDILRPDDGERRGPKGSKKALKPTKIPGGVPFFEGARFTPVPEAVGIMLWVTATHRHQGEGEQHEDENDLPAGKPELSLTVCSHCKDIQATSSHTESLVRVLDSRRSGTKDEMAGTHRGIE